MIIRMGIDFNLLFSLTYLIIMRFKKLNSFYPRVRGPEGYTDMEYFIYLTALNYEREKQGYGAEGKVHKCFEFSEIGQWGPTS